MVTGIEQQTRFLYQDCYLLMVSSSPCLYVLIGYKLQKASILYQWVPEGNLEPERYHLANMMRTPSKEDEDLVETCLQALEAHNANKWLSHVFIKKAC